MIFDVWFLFYFDPLLIPKAISQAHNVAAVFQLKQIYWELNTN